MRRKVIAIAVALILSILVVFGTTYASQAEAKPQAEEALCVEPVICVTLPPVTLPGVTVTRLVTVAPVTVRVPPVTVREIVTLPPALRTIIVPRTVTVRPPMAPPETVTLPGATLPGRAGTRTVTAPGLPGATTTATVVVSREIIRNGSAPPVTREVRSTLPGRQTTVTSATVVPSKEVVRIPGTTKTVTKFQAVGLTLLGLLALMGLGLFLLWLGFVLGYKSSEKENVRFLKALRDSIRRKPGKHE